MKVTELLLNTFEELWKAREVYNRQRIGKCECEFKKGREKFLKTYIICRPHINHEKAHNWDPSESARNRACR